MRAPIGHLRSAVISLAMSMLGVPLALISSVLVARALGPEGKGVYDVVIGSSLFVSSIASLSLPAAFTYFFARGWLRINAAIRVVVAVCVFQIVVICIVVLVLSAAGLQSVMLPEGHALGAFILTILLAVVTTVSAFLRAALLGIQDAAGVATTDSVQRVLIVVLFLVAWVGLSRLSANALPLVFVGLFIVGSTASIPTMRRLLRGRIAQNENAASYRELMRYGFANSVADIAQLVSYRIDIYFVSYYAGTAELGRYTLAVLLAQLVWLAPTAGATVLFPAAAAGQVTQLSAVTRVARILLYLSAGLGVLIVVLAPTMVALVYGPGFEGVAETIMLLMPGIVVFALSKILGAYNSGTDRVRYNTLASICGSFVTIALDIYLIPTLGRSGAAIATSVSYAVTTVVVLYFYVRSGGSIRQLLIPAFEDFVFVREKAALLIGRMSQ
jgi:O-antigen/teichoic acid export membrane protein